MASDVVECSDRMPCRDAIGLLRGVAMARRRGCLLKAEVEQHLHQCQDELATLEADDMEKACQETKETNVHNLIRQLFFISFAFYKLYGRH